MFSLLLFFYSINVHASESPSPYGKVFLVEDKGEYSRVSLGISGAYEASNAFYHVGSIGLGVDYSITRWVQIGLLGHLHASTPTTLTNAVTTMLETDAIQLSMQRPMRDLFLQATLTPFFGRFNLLDATTMPFDFCISMGAGMSESFRDSHFQISPSLLWGVEPRFRVSQIFTVGIGIGQVIDFPTSESVRARFNVEVSLRAKVW